MESDIFFLGKTSRSTERFIISSEIYALADAAGFKVTSDVDWRGPSDRFSVLNAFYRDIQFSWHRDILSEESDYLGVWSNVAPTMIKTSQGVIQLDPYELAFFRNDTNFHRSPVETMSEETKRIRFFARVHAYKEGF